MVSVEEKSDLIPACMVHEDERKRTAIEVSKRYEMVVKTGGE